MNYEFPIKADSHADANARKEQILNVAKNDGYIVYCLIARICDPNVNLDNLEEDFKFIKWTYEDLTRPRGMWLNNKFPPNKSLWLKAPESEKDNNRYYAVWNENHNFDRIDDDKEDTRRPCVVRLGRIGKKTWQKGYFHKWVANTFPTDGFLFSNMLGLVELEDGSVVQKEPKCIIFVDGGGFDKWEDNRQ